MEAILAARDNSTDTYIMTHGLDIARINISSDSEVIDRDVNKAGVNMPSIVTTPKDGPIVPSLPTITPALSQAFHAANLTNKLSPPTSSPLPLPPAADINADRP